MSHPRVVSFVPGVVALTVASGVDMWLGVTENDATALVLGLVCITITGVITVFFPPDHQR